MSTRAAFILKFLSIFLVITLLTWIVDTSGLVGTGWRPLPKLPAPLEKAETLAMAGFYGYSITVEAGGARYACQVFGQKTCTWEPSQSQPGEQAASGVHPFLDGADCKGLLPFAARLRWGDRQLAACAAGPVFAEFFSGYKVAVIADAAGDLWTFTYAKSTPSTLICLPFPFFWPLLASLVIVELMNGKKLLRWLRDKRKSATPGHPGHD